MNEPIGILCVANDIAILNSIIKVFIDSDYEIITAQSGKEGLDILNNNVSIPAQIVIADYKMPEMDGVEFLQKVSEIFPNTIRIALSEYTDTNVVVQAVNSGRIYKVISIPWNDDTFKIEILNAVERYFLYKKNTQLTDKLKKTNEEIQKLNKYLEKLAKERNSMLMVQRKVINHSQEILNYLPVAVVGVDTEGSLVLCNKKGMNLINFVGENIVGMNREDILPENMNMFIDRLIQKGKLEEHIEIDGFKFKTNGSFIKRNDGWCGALIVFYELEN